MQRHPGRVEDYTNATLVLLGVNLTWIFGVLWSIWGLFPVLLLGIAGNHLIDRIRAVRARRDRMSAPLPRDTPHDNA